MYTEASSKMTERCSRYRAHDFIISFYLSRCAKIKCS
nr:MAG TPA: hypothetical protein [Microviridae sp.]